MSNIILNPSVGLTGLFSFKPPFDTKFNQLIEYTITGQWTIPSLHDQGLKPFETVYKPVGLTEEDFNNDVKNGVLISEYSSPGCSKSYVPNNRLNSIPISTGIKYVNKVLAINLNNVPMDYDLTMLKEILLETVYEASGIKSTISEILNGAPFDVSPEDDTVFRALLANGKKVDKGYKTKYLETLKLLENKNNLIANLEKCMKNKCS